MIRVTLLAVMATPSMAQAEAPQTWLSSRIEIPTRAIHGGTWHPAGGALFATDPLTLWQAQGDPIAVPDAPAAVYGLLETEHGRPALLALFWSNTDVVCGHDLATIAVDTGLAGFMTPADVAALETYANGTEGPYHGTFAEQLDANTPTIPFLAELPDGTAFPVTGSGYGDGGYPVTSLHDADGNMVALYAQFIAAEDWLSPPSCDAEPIS